MPFYELKCDACNREWVRYSKIDDRNLPCEECQGAVTQQFKASNYNVIGDDIPGGIVIRHGLCNPDGSPRKYYTKSEMAKEAEKRGLVNTVRHVGDKGSDKSKNTVRWV